MKLFLHSSSGQPALVLWQKGVVFEVAYDKMQRLDYGAELGKALAEAGREMAELSEIIVDIGPGRLGSTRTAVAFANGLSYARGVPVVGLNAFTMLGVYAEATHGAPCLVLRSAARAQYHWGLVQDGIITEAGFSTDGTVSPAYRGPLVIAGDGAPERVSLPEGTWLSLNSVPGEALGLLMPHLPRPHGPVVPLIDTKALANG